MNIVCICFRIKAQVEKHLLSYSTFICVIHYYLHKLPGLPPKYNTHWYDLSILHKPKWLSGCQCCSSSISGSLPFVARVVSMKLNVAMWFVLANEMWAKMPCVTSGRTFKKLMFWFATFHSHIAMILEVLKWTINLGPWVDVISTAPPSNSVRHWSNSSKEIKLLLW